MKKICFLLILISSIVSVLNAQNVVIPDANFKSELVNNPAINTNMDAEIQVTEAQAFTGRIDVTSKNIASLVGIEAFTGLTALVCSFNPLLNTLDLSANTALTILDCRSNGMTTLDLSTNTALDTLYCIANELTTLDVSNNTALTALYCTNNDLTALDVSTNTALRALQCSYNPLGNLDISANTALNFLNCSMNQLTTLDLSNNTALISLHCDYNQLTTLDLSANTNLTTLTCRVNQLTTLNLSANAALTFLEGDVNYLTDLDLSACNALTFLNCGGNDLTTLDLSANTALTFLDCSANDLTTLDLSANTALTALFLLGVNNKLTALNIKNGNNTNITNSNFYIINNPNLTCVEVDDIAYSSANWTNKDATASYSTNCLLSSTTLSGEKMGVNVYPNPTNSNLTINLEKVYSVASVQVHNAIGQTVFFKEYNIVNQIDMNLEGTAGIYFMNIRTEEGETIIKIVKE